MASKDRISRFLSFILRHSPQTAGISLDGGGWADVNALIKGANTKGFSIDAEILEEIVRTDGKQRYTYNADKTKIRASQGHSLKIDLGLSPACAPDILYHGTAERFLESIKQSGLQRMNRNHVHLSADILTADAVGSRHGKAAVLEIDAAQMQGDGYPFFLSENNVWLTEQVPVRYIKF